MPIPNDPKLLDIACDVTIRFRAHRSYGDEPGALRALRRRAPGHTPDEYRSVFQFLLAVYDRAVGAIAGHPVHWPDKTNNYAEPEAIDFHACLAELDEIEPGLAMREKGWILNWCIFWHYLK